MDKLLFSSEEIFNIFLREADLGDNVLFEKKYFFFRNNT